jgi:hypothetical protein
MAITSSTRDITRFALAVGSEIDGEVLLATAQDLNHLYAETRTHLVSWPGSPNALVVPASTTMTAFAAPFVTVPDGLSEAKIYAWVTGSPSSCTLRVAGIHTSFTVDLTLTAGVASRTIDVSPGDRSVTLSVANAGGTEIEVSRILIVAEPVT